jgi:hypothetical protein
MAVTPSTAKPYLLKPWYSSEEAKRSLGSICKACNVKGKKTYILGTSSKPLAIIEDADEHQDDTGDVVKTLDEARADWSAIIDAVLLYGTKFRISNNNGVDRAVLFRHPDNRHPAVRYQRSANADVEKLAQKLEALTAEVRKLGSGLKRLASSDWQRAVLGIQTLPAIVGQLGQSAELIDRRFREAWRLSDGLPIQPPH